MEIDLAKPFADKIGSGVSAFEIAQMPEIKFAFFKDKDITLDGWRLIGCRFENCTLNVSSSYFSIERCFVDAKTVVQWEGDAIKLVQLFNMRDDDMRAAMPEFAAVKNSDGSYTIGD